MSEDLKLHSLNYDEKGLDMSVSGEPAKLFMMMLVNFFEQNGGKNFITMTVHNSGKKYEITIVNQNGKDTPAEKIERYEKALKEVLSLSDRTNHSACVEIARRVLEGE